MASSQNIPPAYSHLLTDKYAMIMRIAPPKAGDVDGKASLAGYLEDTTGRVKYGAEAIYHDG